MMFMEGEFTELEYGADIDMGAANNMAIAQPSMPFADMDDSNYHTAFYYTPASGGVIKYLDENGEIAQFPAIAEEELPAGWSNVGPANQNGMDVFLSANYTYAVRARSYKAWQSNFIISDENGHVIFSTNYAPELGGDPENAGKSGNGCNLIARKVSDTKVELYQIYISVMQARASWQCTEITLPEKNPQNRSTSQVALTAGIPQIRWNSPSAKTASTPTNSHRPAPTASRFLPQRVHGTNSTPVFSA